MRPADRDTGFPIDHKPLAHRMAQEGVKHGIYAWQSKDKETKIIRLTDEDEVTDLKKVISQEKEPPRNLLGGVTLTDPTNDLPYGSIELTVSDDKIAWLHWLLSNHHHEKQ